MVDVGWLLLDVRQALRQLTARPAFTLATLIILSVGIGANTATFSLVHGLLLRPLPYPDSERIVSLGQVSAGRQRVPMLSNTDLLLLWDDARSFEQLAAYSQIPVVLDGADGPANLSAAAVSPSLFPLLRATPQLGRVFTDADAVDGAHRIVLLSHSTWTNRFRSDPDIVGAPVELNDEPHIIVGVLSDGFEFPTERTELWTPLVVEPDPEPVDGGIVIEGAFSGIGRLRPGVSTEQAATEVRTILDRAAAERRRPPGFRARDPRDLVARRARPPVPAAAPDAGRGHRPGAADGLRQRGRPAARARDRAPARTRHPRRPRRGDRPNCPPTADRERCPQPRRRCAGPRRDRRDHARRARDGSATRARTRPGRCRRNRARLRGRLVDRGRSSLRRRPGARLGARRPGAPDRRRVALAQLRSPSSPSTWGSSRTMSSSPAPPTRPASTCFPAVAAAWIPIRSKR